MVGQWEDSNVCIIGDFNAITEVRERDGEGPGTLSRGSRGLKELIMSCRLTDVRLQGRRFTWYCCNGKCKSKIDRALVNERWVETWRDTSLRGLPRSISDHCPIILDTKETDWGSRPFRFINAWTSHPEFLDVVENSWYEEGIQGWGCFVFKEKLKRLK